MAVPEIMECLEGPRPMPFVAETIEFISDWSPNRKAFWHNRNVGKVLRGEYDAMHPFKLSPVLDPHADIPKKSFCQEILPALHTTPP